MTQVLLLFMCFMIIGVCQGSVKVNGKPQRNSQVIQKEEKREYKLGETASIVCEEQEIIQVSSAEFVNSNDACNPTQNARNVCDGKRSCTFTVDTEIFGEECTSSESKLFLQFKCIPEGLPCPWRNRIFDLFINGSLVSNFTFSPDGMFLSVGGRPYLQLVKLLGTFIILKYPDGNEMNFIDGKYVCFKFDSDQSNKNTFVLRNGLIRGATNICTLCSVNGEKDLIEGKAQDYDAFPTDPESFDQFCDSPMGCQTKTDECTDDGSFDSIGGCPA